MTRGLRRRLSSGIRQHARRHSGRSSSTCAPRVDGHARARRPRPERRGSRRPARRRRIARRRSTSAAGTTPPIYRRDRPEARHERSRARRSSSRPTRTTVVEPGMTRPRRRRRQSDRGEPTMIDPVTLAVVRGALEQIADEMDLHLIHAAISPIISETNDCAHGIFHPTPARRSRRAATACRCSSPTCSSRCRT